MLPLRIFLSLSLLLISCNNENEDVISSDSSLSVLLNDVEWKDFNETQFGNSMQMSVTGTMTASSEEKRVHISLKRLLDDVQSISFRNVPAAEGFYYLEKSGDIGCEFLQAVGKEDLLMCKSYELLDYPEAAAKAGLKNFINIEKHDEGNRQISGSFGVSFLLKESFNCASGGEANLPDTLNFSEGKFKFQY
jgi:hypothetical protein